MIGASYDYELWLADPHGVIVLEDAGGGMIDNCGAEVGVPFTVPEGLASGPYVLRFKLQKDDEDPDYYSFMLNIAGLDTGLDLWTDKDIYRVTEPVRGLGTLTNGELPVVGGLLHLDVVRLRPGALAPEWPAAGRDVGRTFFSPGTGEIGMPRLAWEQTPAENSGYWTSDGGPVLGDLNGNGSAEVVYFGGDGTLRVYQGDGSLLWENHLTDYNTTNPVPPFGTIPQIHDVDLDGVPEIVIQLPERVASLDGMSGQIEWEAPLEQIYSAGVGIPLGVADLNGDGEPEVFHLDFEGSGFNITAFLRARRGSDGTPLWDTRTSGLPLPIDVFSIVTAGDLDGDGTLEILVTNQQVFPVLMAVRHDGSLLWSSQVPLCTNIAPPVAADLDGDGKDEVVVSCSAGGDVIWQEPRIIALDGSNGSVLWDVMAVWMEQPFRASSLTVADLNGDGVKDVVASFSNDFSGMSVVSAVDAYGNGLWVTGFQGIVVPGMPASDLDGDGQMELLVRDHSAVIQHSLRLLDGTTGNEEWNTSYFGIDVLGFSTVALGDVDGDGWLEIVLASTSPIPVSPEGSYMVIDSETTSGPAAGGEIVEEVLWETDRSQELAAFESINLDEDIGVLGVTGQLWFRGWLTSSMGQELARDKYPFLIVEGDQAVSLMTDSEVYPEGSTATVSGKVTEITGLSVIGLDLTVREVDGAILYQETFDLDAFGEHPYEFTMPVGALGLHDLVAELELVGSLTASALARYRVQPITVSVEFQAPEVVGVEPFDLIAPIENTGQIQADLEVTLSDPSGQESRSLSLLPGEKSTQTYERSITEDTTFTLDVTGDITWFGTKLVRFGPASFIEVIPFTYNSADEPVDIPWTLSNTGLMAYDYGMSIEILDSSNALVDGISDSFFLEEPGDPIGRDTVTELWNPILGPGDYTARYSAEFGNNGEAPFTVGLPTAVATVSPQATYPEGMVDVPWSVTNTSPDSSVFAVDLAIERGGQVVAGWTLQVFLGVSGDTNDTFEGLMQEFLDAGSYLARVSGERILVPAVAGFEVLPSMDVSFGVAEGVASCGVHPFDATVTNAGWDDFSGFVAVESDFWLDRVEVSASGQGGSWAGTLQVELAFADVGDHPVVFRLHDSAGNVVAETQHTVSVQGGVCALASAPAYATFPAGGEASFPFTIENRGDQRARCLLELGAYEEQGPEQALVSLEPCASEAVGFTYLLPWDQEAGDQMLPYELEPAAEGVSGSERGFVIFGVEGVDMAVTAALDKCFYRPGETAHLELAIENTGAVSDVPLIAEVSYPGTEYDHLFTHTTESQVLSFEIPLGDITTDHIFYAIRFTSGRAIHINTKRVYGGDEGFWLCTDRDVYDAGDSVQITFGSDEDCQFKIRQIGSGYEYEAFVAAGEVGEASFTLPTEIRQGTHVIEYGCDVLTVMHPIEVRGFHIRFLYLMADSNFYLPGDGASLEALIECGPGFTGPFHCIVEKPDKKTFDFSIDMVTFEEGYQYINVDGVMDTDQAGQHQISCTVYLDEEEQIHLARDWTQVQVGDYELLGITTDKPWYESGYDAATVLVRMWGYLPAADLSVDYDENPLHAQVVQLDGFSTVSIPLTIEQIRDLGTHSLSGTLTAEEMVSSRSHTFETKDTIPPEITVTGVEDGGLYSGAVVPMVEVFDMNPLYHNVSLDSAIWASGMEVRFDGEHLLAVEAVDLADNRSEVEISFIIDTTTPVVTLNGVEDGRCYSAEVTPEWVVDDPRLVSVDATLDGAPLTSGDIVGEGTHTLHIVAVDEAGNTAEVSATFTVDLTDPVVVIEGVADGLVADLDVFPVVTFEDDNLIFGQAYLNGAEFQSGTVVTEEGNHIIEGWAFDCAGRQTFESARFSIDRTPPELALYFIEDGGCYYPPVWPTFAAYDTNLVSVEATLDGSVFENGSGVDAEGIHTLYVEAEDAVGHVSTLTATFILDATPPVLTVSGVQDGEFYNTDVVVAYSATDANDVETYGVLDGEDYTSGTPIQEEDSHDIVVVATDCADNQDAFAATFVIDKTPPVVKVEGVEDGKIYSRPVTPYITVTDEYLDQVIIELDDLPFQSGTEVPEEGSHLLFVEASDLAGNVTTVTVAFEISLGTRPPFHFAICAFGSVLMENHAAVIGYDRERQVKTYDGDVAAHGDVTMRNNPFIAGDVVAGGNLSMSHNADIYGDAYVAGNVTLKHQARVHGQIHELGSPPEPCECGYDLDAVLAYREENNDNDILEADPSVSPHLNDGILKVEHNDRVTLPGGVFYLDSIILRNNAQLSIAEGAQVELYVVHDFTIRNHAGLSNDPLRAEDLLVVLGTDTSSGDSLEIHNNTDLGIMLYAPRADLEYPNNAHLYGSIVIRDFHEENHGRIMVYDSLTSDPPRLVCE